MSSAYVFDEHYSRYDAWYERHRLLAESELLAVKRSMEGAGRPCLEVGVGSGYFASLLGCEVGVDPSLNMLTLARGRGIEVVAGRGERLPFADASFKTLLLVVTLCFVDDPVEVMKESSRVLVDDGILVACIVPRDSEWGRHYMSLGGQGHVFYRVARFYTVNEVVEMGEGAGFRLDGVTGTLTYPPWGEDRLEEPGEYRGFEGFACLRFEKARELKPPGSLTIYRRL